MVQVTRGVSPAPEMETCSQLIPASLLIEQEAEIGSPEGTCPLVRVQLQLPSMLVQLWLQALGNHSLNPGLCQAS